MEVQEVEPQDHPIASGKAQGSYGFFWCPKNGNGKKCFQKTWLVSCFF